MDKEWQPGIAQDKVDEALVKLSQLVSPGKVSPFAQQAHRNLLQRAKDRGDGPFSPLEELVLQQAEGDHPLPNGEASPELHLLKKVHAVACSGQEEDNEVQDPEENEKEEERAPPVIAVPAQPKKSRGACCWAAPPLATAKDSTAHEYDDELSGVGELQRVQGQLFRHIAQQEAEGSLTPAGKRERERLLEACTLADARTLLEEEGIHENGSDKIPSPPVLLDFEDADEVETQQVAGQEEATDKEGDGLAEFSGDDEPEDPSLLVEWEHVGEQKFRAIKPGVVSGCSNYYW